MKTYKLYRWPSSKKTYRMDDGVPVPRWFLVDETSRILYVKFWEEDNEWRNNTANIPFQLENYHNPEFIKDLTEEDIFTELI